jgi:hypothetical protein
MNNAPAIDGATDTPRTDAVAKPGEYGQDWEIVDAA